MKIPFGKVFKVSEAQLRDGIAQGLIDGYQDYEGAYKSRPGLTEQYNLGQYPIDGLFVDTIGNTIIVTGGLVYVRDTSDVITQCTGVTLNQQLCTFAEDNQYIYIAHGGRIVKLDRTAKTMTELNGASAPDDVTHIIFCQGYLACNGSGGVVGDTFYTGPFTAVDYPDVFEIFNSEQLPDGNLAVATDGNLIYSFGGSSIELATNDGVTPWAKYQSGYVPFGIHAPYTLAAADNTFLFLGVADNAVRVLTVENGQAKTLSTPYDSIINGFTDSDQAYAYTCGIDGHTFYVIQFTTMTLVYHLQTQAWYRWGQWSSGETKYNPFWGRTHAYHWPSNKNIFGNIGNAKVASFEGFTDLGNPVRFELTSGNISANTYAFKRAARMRFQLERGTSDTLGTEPVIRWQCRDNGGTWQPERSVSLGQQGNYEFLGQLDRCGIYRQRQHRIIFTDPTCQMVFVEAEEFAKLSRDA